MGRGRAKAKQTKVARELKYNSGGFDPDALRAELVGSEAEHSLVSTQADDEQGGEDDDGEDD